MTYSNTEVELVVIVVEIHEGNDFEVLATVVVAPVDGTRGDDDHVSSTDPAYLLVLVFLFVSMDSP